LTKFREGDFIETSDGNIFDVKGYVHPVGKVIAFIRYTPNQRGERKKSKALYQKVYPLQERYELLKERFPQYLVHDLVFDEWLCEVSINVIRRHYKPSDRLRILRQKKRLTSLESAALRFAELLKRSATIGWNALGISGSLLVELHTATSDIDIIAYGTQNCYKVHNSLKALACDRNSRVKSYDIEELWRLFGFRSKDTRVSFEDFIRTESRKVLQGRYEEHDYFIRCVKDWGEISERYGDVHYSNVGYVRIRATIVDDSEAIFTPCKYRVENVNVLDGKIFKPISEIASFRGRFCEQAKQDEVVVAQGKLERVRSEKSEEYFRLLLGNMPSDFMVLD
jgi:hypothetical protein